MKQLCFSKLVILIALLFGWNSIASAQTTTTFSSPGGPYAYTVPSCTYSVSVTANGGAGGAAGPSSSLGSIAVTGFGGRVQCILAVTPGQVLNVYVGGAGQTGAAAGVSGGINGGGASASWGGSYSGGGGGGASDIRIGGTAFSNRVIVAGGGGGGGYNGSAYAGGLGGGTTGGTGAGSSGLGGGGGTPSSGGAGAVFGGYTSGSAGDVGVGGASQSPSPGIGGGGGAGYYGGGGGVWGGAGGGSSYTDPVLATAVAHSQGIVTGDGSVSITTICTPPIGGAIVGAGSMCPGTTLALSNPTTSGCGTWASSNPSIATIDPSTGIVTAIRYGSTTISYSIFLTCGSAAATPVVINVNPLPVSITGTKKMCAGFSTLLSDTGTGTWVSASPLTASVSPTGLVSGLNAGTAVISYTLSTGCAPVTATVTVNPVPSPISATTFAVCASGGTATLSDGLSGGVWSSSAPATANINAGTGAVTGNIAGTVTITYSVTATGCNTNTTFTVNPLPSAIFGGSGVCVGSTVTLSDLAIGGVWSSSNVALAAIDPASGLVNGYLTGNVTITYMIGATGCKTTSTLNVNPVPVAIAGVASDCIGSTTTLSDATSGGTWSSSNTAVATVTTFGGVVSGISIGTANIIYSLPTGCSASVLLPVNQLPVAYTTTGGGNYCPGSPGVHIGLSYGDPGVTYALSLGGSIVSSYILGAGTSLDFYPITTPGVYTVVAYNPSTGCSSNMTGTKTVGISTPPAVADVTGGGGYCIGTTGSPVGLDASAIGVGYQLYNGTAVVGTPVAGTGLPLSFGSFTTPGTYTIIGTSSSTGCSSNMASNATITIYPQPTLETVGGVGGYCEGGTGSVIILGGSDGGTIYQLYYGTIPIGSSLSGTGSSLSFPPQTATGTYTVVATNGYGCNLAMTGSTTVVINPLPAPYAITGGGAYCSGSTGVHVGMLYGNIGITYKLISPSSTVVSTLSGTNTSLDFGIMTTPGTYTVQAVNSVTACSSTMPGSATVSINAVPAIYNVLGSGGYCVGSSGPDVYTDGSQPGIRYQLYKGTTAVGTYLTETGGANVDFGDVSAPGTYTVIAKNAVTTCTSTMNGSAVVSVNPLPSNHNVTGGGHYCSLGTGVHVGLDGSNTGTNYQLLLAGVPTGGGPVTGTGTAIDFGLCTAPGTYTVKATDNTTGCTTNMSGSAVIVIDPLPTPYNMTGGGSYCLGGTGLHLGVDGSNIGIIYSLYNGTLTGTYSGTGSSIDFGIKTAVGTYSVIALNPLTSCSVNMNNSEVINITPLPADFPMTSGGNYCAHGTGIDIQLLGSATGVTYQLMYGGVAIGALATGGSGAIDFGNQTGGGTYRVYAYDPATTCSAYMSASANINVVSPAIFTVTGGGNYCANVAPVHVGLSGSSPADAYQLFIDGVAIGPDTTGTGGAIDFGPMATSGTYTIAATDNLLGCMDTMASSAIVGVNPVPAVDSVTGTGSYCIGGIGLHVGLNTSSTGIHYQLYNGGVASGIAMSGTGSPLDFGIKTLGAYAVVATDATTSCTDTMQNTALLTVTPLPTAYMVTAPDSGYYCATDSGLHIFLNSSDPTINYQLYRSSIAVGSPAAGSGSSLDLGLQAVAGTYSVLAINAVSGCNAPMANTVNINIVPLPTVHNVTGGGGYCLAGGTGVHVGLDHSDAGVYYYLRYGGIAVDSLYGTDSTLDFGLRTATGDYTVIGNSRITTCPNAMLGTADVFIDTLLTPNVTIQSFPAITVGVWHVDSMSVSVTNGGTSPTYQWYVNTHAIFGANTASFTNHEFFNNDSVSCMVTASGPCGGLSTSKYIIVKLENVGVAQVSASGNDVKLIPNPNKGSFAIKGSLGSTIDQQVSLEVTNMLGQVIYTTTTTTQNGSINEHIQLGNNLPNGMYILNMRSGSENTVFHFVIEQ